MIANANAKRLPFKDNTFHMCVTSPPYWSLRDYKVAGQLGLEATPDEYVANMVAVFREVWRVLRDDGTLWLNIGDSYAANGSNGTTNNTTHRDIKEYGNFRNGLSYQGQSNPRTAVNGLKPKDLVGIPWRVAFALQADGWYLRSDIIWSKPNPMPESVTDRPTKAHEYLFLLAKQPRYYYDALSISEEGAGRENFGQGQVKCFDNHDRNDAGRLDMTVKGYRNRRTVWTIPTSPYPGAHFATFPPALIEPCIKAGTSERGVCPVCGKQWVRETETSGGTGKSWHNHQNDIIDGQSKARLSSDYSKTTTGWRADCNHDAEPIPALVFDPFVGSGTTVQVAYDLGRRGVGIDLSMKYLTEQAGQRIHNGHVGRLM